MYDARFGNPEFERPQHAPRPRGSWLPVMVVLGFIMLVVVGLIGLTGLAGIYIVVALTGVLGFAAMHYLLWGWWLTNKLRAQQEAEDDAGE
ncbi:MAG: hypothetical protein AB7O59_23130 [Pirellulales bacterium]